MSKLFLQSEPQYQSLISNQIQPNDMTYLNNIFPENPQKCQKCITEHINDSHLNNNKQTVLSRGIHADKLEPEYYRYNKTISFQSDEITRKYLQYKPRRPKCPIVFNKLYPSEQNNEHLFKNPLYNYPIDENLREMDFQWITKSTTQHKQVVKNLITMMKEMDETYVTY